MTSRGHSQTAPWRRWLVASLLVLAGCVLVARVVDLQVLDTEFLRQQGDARTLRVVSIPAHRGMITDRNGEPLAISTPMDSVWVNPKELVQAPERWPALAKALALDPKWLRAQLESRPGREFVYLKRHVEPEVARRVVALHIPGVNLRRELRRFYPAGEVASHVLGFTNIDDVGQVGIERAYDDWLRGTAGSKRVLKDRLRRTVQDVDIISDPRPGHDLAVSIDQRIQYLAYRELKAAVKDNEAHSGSLVLLDAGTGEVLALVNQPGFNPNNRTELQGPRYRNRALTDPFEPGSAIKPFTIACGLQSGLWRPDTIVDTRPGTLRVGRKLVRDVHDYGVIDVATVIKKSSNVGASKIALSVSPQALWETFSRVGLGSLTGSSFPDESAGYLGDYHRWKEVERATLSYGYGLSVTPVQLARAFTVLATGGILRPVSFVRLDSQVPGKQVLDPKIATEVRAMLAGVVADGGTATEARVPGYQVGGKTGTVLKTGPNGYMAGRYRAVFAGIAPLSKPRLVMVIVIDDPRGKKYYGGLVAAPVFAAVMAGALRLLGIPPDDLPPAGERYAKGGGSA